MGDFNFPVQHYDPSMLEELTSSQLAALNYHHYDNTNLYYYNQVSLIHSINAGDKVTTTSMQKGGNHHQINPERLLLDNPLFQIELAASNVMKMQQRKRKSEEYHGKISSSLGSRNSSDQSPHSVSDNIRRRPKKVSAGRFEKRGRTSTIISTSAGPSTATNKAGTKKLKPEEGEEHEQQQQREVVHMRAKRGQATDSHSLAERVRRGKINEKMKYLQEMVPGCSYNNSNRNKTMGMAVVLDEIINYVQSLQHQVEFLSMKLTAASVLQEFNSNSTTTSLSNYESPDHCIITMPVMEEATQNHHQQQPPQEEAEMRELLIQHDQQQELQQHYLQPLSWSIDHCQHQSTWPSI